MDGTLDERAFGARKIYCEQFGNGCSRRSHFLNSYSRDFGARRRSIASILAACAFLGASLNASVGQALVVPAGNATDIKVKFDRVSSRLSLSGVGLRLPGVSPRETEGYRAFVIEWRRLDRQTSETSSKSAASEGARAGRVFEWQVRDRDSSSVLARFSSRRFDFRGSSLRIGLKPMPDRLSIQPVDKEPSKADLVATMNIDTYIRGVLPSEMPKSWPIEALKAQAIAARTFALHRKEAREKAGAPFHVESTVMDQAFQLPIFEEGEDQDMARVEQAVRETKGLVMLDRRGRPFATFFHSDCGGRTEEATEVWGQAGLGTAVDGSCPFNPKAKWDTVVTEDEVARRLRGPREMARVALVELVEESRTPSGRVGRLRAKWSDGSSTETTGHEFRMAMGHEKVRSANFRIEKREGGGLRLVGRGFGHGVGMCQWGARKLAGEGKSYREILAHYYPRAELEEIELAARD